MKKGFCIFPFLILLSLVIFSSFSYSTTTDQEITKSYINSDYVTAVSLLEKQIKEQKLKGSKDERGEYVNLYKKYLLLAHIYAWRLNKPDVALLRYQELNELRRSYKEASKFPPFELLYIAEIYEVKNDYPKASERYQYLLNELIDFKEKENDDFSILMSEDLIKFLKYQIDSLHLKARTEKRYKPLLTRLKLSSQLTVHFFPFLALSLVPTAEYIFSPDKPIDLVDKIKQSPSDFSSMILNYALILAASAGTVDESSEKAMEAYLSKYPESYYSLQLRYLFYKFYKESGQTQKAEKLAKELDKIGSKRGIELIIDPDKRFSSPEKTWETYRKALIAGNIDIVAECYVPGEWKNRKAFAFLGKEKMKEIGERMGNIGKIIATEQEAKYRIRRIEGDKEITYYIFFHNFDGEWKMRDF
jgi:hypothetical protein